MSGRFFLHYYAIAPRGFQNRYVGIIGIERGNPLPGMFPVKTTIFLPD